MTSDMNGIAGVGAGRAPAIERPAPVVSQAARAVAAAPPDRPRINAPKQVELQVDTVKAKQNLQEAVRALNQQIISSKTGLGFSVDPAVGGPVVTVRKADTGEVIRQIPNEVVVRMAHSIDALKGLLLDKAT